MALISVLSLRCNSDRKGIERRLVPPVIEAPQPPQEREKYQEKKREKREKEGAPRPLSKPGFRNVYVC